MTDVETSRSGRSVTRRGVGIGFLAVAVLGTVTLSFVPAPYVIETPGPVYNTLGTAAGADGKDVPLITVEGATTYPTEGELSMLTVWASGSPGDSPTWLDVVSGWFRPEVAVVPMESMYPTGTSRNDSVKAGQVQMDTSKQEAIAAALSQLDIPFASKIQVAEATPGYPAAKLLQQDDIIESADGIPVGDVSALRALIKKAGIGHSIDLVITRGTETLTVAAPIVASQQDNTTPVIGILTGGIYDFPFTVDIQINDVGGPSAGMMFALGIIDTLTPGSLTGGENIAGTGEIVASGEVGTIGGIVQKAYGARDSGATWMLVPKGNCDDLADHAPAGLRIVAVSTLAEAYAAVTAIGTATGADSLPTCPTP